MPNHLVLNRRSAMTLVTLVALLVGSTRLTANDATGGGPPNFPCDSCGAIVATLSSSKTWAYYHATNAELTKSITIDATVSDKDTRPSDGECIDDTATVTEWTATSGTVSPVNGIQAIWKPNAKGDNFKVIAKVNDGNTPCDDAQVTPEVVVKAFQVKIDMTVTYNGVSKVAFAGSLWDYETTSLDHHWNDLGFTTTKRKWLGATIIDGEADEKDASIHIEYTYRSDPDSADLYGGSISGTLATSAVLSGSLDVEDADSIDGSVTLSLGVGAIEPIGFDAGIEFNAFPNDCAEAGAAVARGYYTDGGLGTTASPGVGANQLVKTSADEYDISESSGGCYQLNDGNFPPNSYYTSHIYNFNPPQIDTTWLPLLKQRGTVVKAGHVAYAGVMLKSSGTDYSGAGATATISGWTGAAKVSTVFFKP